MGRPFDDCRGALARAYRLLDRLEADPLRHVRHAAKVLIKFHLLEVRTISTAALAEWAESAPYFIEMHARYFADRDLRDWLSELAAELLASGALTRYGDEIREPGD